MTGLAIRARRLRDQAVTAAEHRPVTAVLLAAVRRDIEVGGTLLAGALGFRLFIWLLPCCLLATAVLGFTESSGGAPGRLANDLGMSPLTTSVVGQLSEQAERGRWLTALLGLVLLAWAGFALARALDRVHGRVWRRRLDRAPGPVLARAARYNLVLLLIVLSNMAGPVVAAALSRPPALVSLPALGLYTLLGIVLLSPGWPPRWRSAWPGAVLIAVGAEGLHLVAVVYLPGKLARSAELYGALGVAAAVLVWLTLITRLVVLGQVLNAVLAERAHGHPPGAGDVHGLPAAQADQRHGNSTMCGGRPRTVTEQQAAGPAAQPLADARVSENWEGAGRHWGPQLGNGLLMFLTGSAVLVWPRPTLTVVAWLFAITLLVNGIVQVMRSIAHADAPGGHRVFFGLLGALSLLAGVLCLRSPTQTLGVIALLIGSWWIVSGVLTLVAAAGGVTGGNRLWSALLGVLSVLGGAVVLLQPAISLVALEITLGVSLIVLGTVVVVDAAVQRHRAGGRR